ncbi:golgin Putative 6 [Wolffia australiana]
MDFKFGRINLNAVAQGVGGLVFGKEDSSSNEDSYVERLLDRISNGVLADDRRSAITELQSLVAESRPAQMAFGAIGLPVIIGVLKEERDDVEMVRGALETLVSAMTPIDTSLKTKNVVQSASMNSDLLSREPENISLILSLLSEDDFYIRYYTLQLLTALLTHSPHRLQEAILSVPRGITRLMDMLMDREVIRNEALLLLTHLTREAEEIQKIVVFEGIFEKIFSIIREEGGSEGGVVVQDCLELLNNLIRKAASNQILLRETVGFEPLVSVLKLHRGSAFNFTQQKTVNLLCALETIELLLVGGSSGDPGKETNRFANQMVLAQKKILDHLLMLGVESQWASVSVRCSALRCIGNLVFKNPSNLDALAIKVVGEEPHVEPALNSILRLILRASSVQEFRAADHVFKCFCEENSSGKVLLASTMTPQPLSLTHASVHDSGKLSFGSILLQGLVVIEADGDLETSCRAASVLSHILKDNIQSKVQALRIVLDSPIPSFGPPEPLLHRLLKYLVRLTSVRVTDGQADRSSSTPTSSHSALIIFRLIATWLAEFPDAVECLLDSSAHLTYLLDLLSSPHPTLVRGLSSLILGECVIFNEKPGPTTTDALAVIDSISQRIGLSTFFQNIEELQKSLSILFSASVQHRRPLTRSMGASTAEAEETGTGSGDHKLEYPIISAFFDVQFADLVKNLEARIRDGVVKIYGQSKNKVAVVPAELEQKSGESDGDYIKRLRFFVEKQCTEMQDLLARNSSLAEDLSKTGGAASDPASGRERIQSENLRRDLLEANQRVDLLRSDKAKIEEEATMYKNLAEKLESDLKGLSDAYNSLEQNNFQLETELKALRKGGGIYPDVEAIRAQAREEAEKESEVELNDLLVCLGQEQSKVEKLSARLAELGEDVDSLLEGIGDDAALPDEDD